MSQTQAQVIFDKLKQTYPDADCELDFTNPLQLLVATVLSAQSTDVGVNKVTPQLFARYPTALDYAQAELADVEDIIRPTGFFRRKAEAIVGIGRALVERFDGQVPADQDALVALPGVGRKTANVVLGHAFGIPGVTPDTHVMRVSRRLGFTTQTDPDKVEHDLEALFHDADLTKLSDTLIFHGRRCCHARKPACGACPVAEQCPSFGEGPTDRAEAAALIKVAA